MSQFDVLTCSFVVIALSLAVFMVGYLTQVGFFKWLKNLAIRVAVKFYW